MHRPLAKTLVGYLFIIVLVAKAVVLVLSVIDALWIDHAIREVFPVLDSDENGLPDLYEICPVGISLLCTPSSPAEPNSEGWTT